MRVLLSNEAEEDSEMVHFDVKTAFLNGSPKGEIVVIMICAIIDHDHDSSNLVYR